MNLNRVNDEVFVAMDEPVRIGPEEIGFLKTQASRSARQRARICAHKSSAHPLHEMVIAITAKSYIHPHRHLGRPESFHVIEGAVDVVLFDEQGSVLDVVELGAPGSGRQFFYRLDADTYHTLVLKTDFLVVHETTSGPFRKEGTQLAPWAPDETRGAEAGAFMGRVAASARDHLRLAHASA